MPATKPLSGIFKTNATFETSGIWIDYGEYGRFRIARSGGENRAFRNLVQQRLRPYRAGINMGTIGDDVIESVMRECFAEAIVLDWEIVDEDGKPIPFSREKCIDVFKEYPDLFADIVQQSQLVVNFLDETRKADGKP